MRERDNTYQLLWNIWNCPAWIKCGPEKGFLKLWLGSETEEMESREDEGRLGSEKKTAEREGAEGGREGGRWIYNIFWMEGPDEGHWVEKRGIERYIAWRMVGLREEGWRHGMKHVWIKRSAEQENLFGWEKCVEGRKEDRFLRFIWEKKRKLDRFVRFIWEEKIG